MRRRQYGDQDVCSKCGHDVQWFGRENGWRDRGNGVECLPSGKWDENGMRIPAPKGRHMVRRSR